MVWIPHPQSPRGLLANVERLAAQAEAPTRTLRAAADLVRRQATVTVVTQPDNNNNSDSHLSGGAIAGIVVGSVLGFLLLLWIFKSLTNLGAPSDQVDKSRRASNTAWYDDVGAERGGRRRSHSHHSHGGGSRRGSRSHHRDYDYDRYGRSPRRSTEVREVRGPVAVTQPAYVYRGKESRSRSRGY